jgi:hypothetical protein
MFDLSESVATMRGALNNMGTKVRFLETAEHNLATKVVKVDDRVSVLEKSASAPLQQAPLIDTTAEMNSLRAQLASAKAQLASANEHAQQNAIVFGSLATTLQLTRVLLNEKSEPEERVTHDLISATLFSQIINMVNNLWGWTKAQKISIYGAFLHIPAFKTEHDKLI